MSRVLVVSSYPPRHCGVGAYARAEVERLRHEGHEVTVLSPPDGQGDLRVDFFSGRAFRAAARLAPAYDRVTVHFQPSLYYRPRAPVAKVLASWGLLRLCRRPNVEVVVHEADPPRLWRPDYLLLARALRRAPAMLLHTDRERRDLERAYRVRIRARIVPHAQGVRVRGPAERKAARARLGLPPDEPVLVCPGFLHPDKGFDRAIEAFSGGGRLYVVGSVREATPENLAHADRLRQLAARTPGVELVEGFADDEEFDAWIAAADAVVLPYRRSWSSGVLARAQALEIPAVVAAAGGLEEQASDRDVVVRDDRELAAALAARGVWGGSSPGAGTPRPGRRADPPDGMGPREIIG